MEVQSNKLLTTAFEASLESVAVTLQAKRRQQDNRDEVMKKNQYGQYLKDVMDGKYQEHLY